MHTVALKSNLEKPSLTLAISNGTLISDHADIMDGIVMICLNIFWCLLGLYAKNLAFRLYSSAKFLDMVRLHAKVRQCCF